MASRAILMQCERILAATLENFGVFFLTARRDLEINRAVIINHSNGF